MKTLTTLTAAAALIAGMCTANARCHRRPERTRAWARNSMS